MGGNISGTAGCIREVKPAYVHPSVSEIKNRFFSFDCRADMYGGRKE